MKAIPTMYRGVEFKSRLEANVAAFFDQYGITWEYEPQSFLLEPGLHYWPDFYLPELNTWVECKGIMNELSQVRINKFVEWINNGILRQSGKKYGPDFLLIGPQNCILWEDFAHEFGTMDGSEAYLAICQECGKPFFCAISGSYQCRNCDTWDGDHHIKFFGQLKLLQGVLYIV